MKEILDLYDPSAPLEEASTIPAPWYVEQRVMDRELETVFSRTWQLVGRADQVREPGRYVTWEISNEPIVVVRWSHNVLRGFFNVCRHHAASGHGRTRGRSEVPPLPLSRLDLRA
ncbi:MAG: Rieske 2Fe-2S domain-containing protein [Blastocatellia bacterium]|nr:Rieske 2Fe-2S domain-containing protein [Blastocatellia bacterium]